MGCTIPTKNFIVSDADFVDCLTEAMGGYVVDEKFLKFNSKFTIIFTLKLKDM